MLRWKAYEELAWTETILASPQSYEEEAMIFIRLLQKYLLEPEPTMLHLGCGAGGYDFHFKKHFKVTGVDLSEGMLEIARRTNPEIDYRKDDMREVQLDEQFDAVIIPDSIMYMVTLEDLSAALKNAAAHMKPDGVLMVVSHTKEEFRNNNFAYTGESDGFHITLLENNHIVSDTTYEAVIVYLIRQGGSLRIEHDFHTLGLFSHNEWMAIFRDLDLMVDEVSLDHLYDPYLLEDGQYRLRAFIVTKRAKAASADPMEKDHLNV